MKTLHQQIDDILRDRSKLLHIATSDITNKKDVRQMIDTLDTELVSLIAQLPDNRPEFPRYLWGTPVKVGERNGVPTWTNEIKWILQSVVDGVAKYVSPAKFDSALVRIEPHDRIAELQNQRTLSREVIQTINALEALDINPVEADEADEADAQVAVVVRAIVRGV